MIGKLPIGKWVAKHTMTTLSNKLSTLVNEIYAFGEIEKANGNDVCIYEVFTIECTPKFLEGQNDLVSKVCKQMLSFLNDTEVQYKFDADDWKCTLREVWVEDDKIMALADVNCVGDVIFEVIPTNKFYNKLAKEFRNFKKEVLK